MKRNARLSYCTCTVSLNCTKNVLKKTFPKSLWLRWILMLPKQLSNDLLPQFSQYIVNTTNLNALFWKFGPEVFSRYTDMSSLSSRLLELKRVIWAKVGVRGGHPSGLLPWGVGTGRRKQTLTHVEKEPSEFCSWSGVEELEAETPNYLSRCVYCLKKTPRKRSRGRMFPEQANRWPIESPGRKRLFSVVFLRRKKH